jgi:hypothetical protein
MKQRRAPTKGEMAQQLKEQGGDLSKRVEQMEMATRISQMRVQQVGNSISSIAADVREMANRQRDLQYRLLAVQELTGLDTSKINALSEEKQVADFTEASAKENEQLGYTPGDAIDEDSVVVFTTKTEAEGKSILRSKLPLSDIALPDFREQLLGKKAGESFESELQGVKHKVTLLEVYQKPPAPEPAPAAQTDGAADGQEQQA